MSLPEAFKQREGGDSRWLVLATVQIGILMATIDASIVNIALPTILSALHTTLMATEWVLEAYLLTITVLLLPFGRVADMVGRKKVYTSGFAVFTAGSVLCGLAPNDLALIGFRAVQAVGASMIMANGFAIVTAVFPPRQRGMALGINGTVVAAGFTVGPALGGLLISTLGWRWIFFVNLPVGILGTLAALKVLNERQVTGQRKQGQKFDFAGAGLSALALLGLLVALNVGPELGWATPVAIGGFALFVLLGTAWIAVEARVEQPLVDMALFHRRTFTAGNAAGLLSFLSISANAFLMPFFLQLVLGYSPIQAGLLMTPTALVMAVVAPISGWGSDRVGARVLTAAGLAVNSAALLLLGTLTASAHYSDVRKWLMLLGLGQGLFQSPNNASVMGDVPRERLGIGSGLLAMVRNVGQVVGVAVSASFLLASLSGVAGAGGLGALESGRPGAGDPALVSAFVSGLHMSYTIAAALAAVGIAASLIRGERKGPPPVRVPEKERVEAGGRSRSVA